MRYAVISDLHANESALRRVLADAAKRGVDKVVCLGDVVGYGPLPEETVALARASCAVVLAGNHDDAVSGRGDASSFIDLAGDAVERHRETLSRGSLDWLRSLPYTCEFDGAAAAHGDLVDPPKFYYVENAKDAGENFRATDARLVFVGHTHVPALFVVGRSGTPLRATPQDFTLEEHKRYIVNPGSVGYPRESNGECRSSYVIYDSKAGTVTFHYLPFSVSSVMQRGTAPKRVRKGVLFVAALLIAAVAAAVAWYLAPTSVVAESTDATLVVERRELRLGGDCSKVRANLKLDRGSPPVMLKVKFADADGKTISEEPPDPVKSSSAKQIKVPAGAASAEFTVSRLNPGDEPSIFSFAPAAAK